MRVFLVRVAVYKIIMIMKNKSVLGKVIIAFAMLSLVFVSVPGFVHAATANSGACDDLGTKGLTGVVGCIISVMENLVILLVAAGVLFVVYGAFQMIQSEEKREEGKQRIYHGIIGLFVMFSIWGLVGILDSTFNLSGSQPINPPALGPSSN